MVLAFPVVRSWARRLLMYSMSQSPTRKLSHTGWPRSFLMRISDSTDMMPAKEPDLSSHNNKARNNGWKMLQAKIWHGYNATKASLNDLYLTACTGKFSNVVYSKLKLFYLHIFKHLKNWRTFAILLHLSSMSEPNLFSHLSILYSLAASLRDTMHKIFLSIGHI